MIPPFPFDTVLIANRGLIARRIMRTCRELGLKTIAVYAPGDCHPELLLLADQAIEIPDLDSQSAYLNIQALVSVAQKYTAAIHPGYGFLSENAAFARACLAAGLVWIGPKPEVLELSGNKVTCSELMQQAGLPILTGLGCDHWSESLQSEIESKGFPILLKPSHGGGGIGMHKVTEAKDLRAALEHSLDLARSYFSESTVLIEAWLPQARHIEVQILADQHGNIEALFERECSLQRRHQKVIEEAPAPGLTEAQRQELYALALASARAAKLDQLATVEFLWDGSQFWFLEINPRLQVEHAVTEAITGLDLVELQLLLAAGANLLDLNLPHGISGHAIEARIYAEDPWTGRPAPGRLSVLNLPDGQGLRIECGVYAGMQISSQFDPLLMKMIAFGPNRERAMARLRLALEQLELSGDIAMKTNQASLLAVLNSPEVKAGNYHTQTLEAIQLSPESASENAEIQTLISALDEERRRPLSVQNSGSAPAAPSGHQQHFWRPAHWN